MNIIKDKVFVMSLMLLFYTTLQAQFIHPGISHKQSDLDRMHYLVSAKVEPYYISYLKLKSDGKASYDYTVKGDPSFTVITEKGENSSAFKSDVEAAYLNALMWAVTKDVRHADKCVEIFNAWSNLTCFTGGGTESLNTGRVIFCFLDAAEIIKSTYDGWAEEDLQRFKDMLVYPGYSNVAKPASVTNDNGTFYWRLYQGDSGRHGNQDLFGWRGVLSMGIFLDNEIMYDRALRYLKGLPHREDDIPYVSGPPITSVSPISSSEYADTYKRTGVENTIADYGYNGSIQNLIWENGQSQESSRDQAHTILGVGQLASVAEMAWNQGDDIYSYLDNRILLGYEFNLKYNVSFKYPFPDQLSPWEPTVESGEFIQRRDRSGRWFSKKMNPYTEGQFEEYTRGNFLSSARPVYEIAYAHYKVRQGVDPEDMLWLSRAREISIQECGQEQNGFGLDHLGYGGLTCYRPDGCAGDPVSGFDGGMPVFALNVLPGTVEAENFDHFNGGGESRVYHDMDDTNTGGVYRNDVGLDISECSEGGYALSDLHNGEWVTYSCFVPEPGTYKLDIRYAAAIEGGKISVAINEDIIESEIQLATTGSYTNWDTQTLTENLILSQGLHPIRFYITGADDAFNINSFSLSLLKPNTAPNVSISSPVDATGYVEGDTVDITAEASDVEGNVTKVEFYSGSIFLGEDTEAPYSFTWNYLPVGTHTLTAIATDNNNAISTSDEVSIRVIPNGNTQSIISLAPVADSYVHSSNPMTNYGSDVYMVTKATDEGSGRYFFLKFDLSEINGTISSVTLKVYKRSGSSGSRSAFQVNDDSWTEDGINFGNQPAIGVKISDSSIGTYGSWDVSDFVAAQKGIDEVVTLCVRDANFVGNGIDFHSKESDYVPELSMLVTESHVGIEDNTINDIQVFPNPVQNKVQVKFTQRGYDSIAVYNLLGSKFDEIPVNKFDDEAELDFTGYANGVYLLACKKDHNVRLIKVIKE